MNSSDLASMSLNDICEIYKKGYFPPDLAHLTLSDIVKIAEEEENIQRDVEGNQGEVENVPEEGEELASEEANEEENIQQDLQVNQGEIENAPEEGEEPARNVAAVSNDQERKFWWKEMKPNSNNLQ